jgi:DNA-binding transcriptional ArsR family regulator
MVFSVEIRMITIIASSITYRIRLYQRSTFPDRVNNGIRLTGSVVNHQCLEDFMLKYYEVRSYEQAKVLSNKIRMKIIYVFSDIVPRTAKQIADELELPKSKAHYHVKELFRVGLLELVETKGKGGVIEKYYLPIAEEFHICMDEDEEQRKNGGKSGRYLTVKSLLDEHRDSYLKRTECNEANKQNEGKEELSMYGLYLTHQERQELQSEISGIMKKWSETHRKKHDGAESYKILMSIHRP